MIRINNKQSSIHTVARENKQCGQHPQSSDFDKRYKTNLFHPLENNILKLFHSTINREKVFKSGHAPLRQKKRHGILLAPGCKSKSLWNVLYKSVDSSKWMKYMIYKSNAVPCCHFLPLQKVTAFIEWVEWFSGRNNEIFFKKTCYFSSLHERVIMLVTF